MAASRRGSIESISVPAIGAYFLVGVLLVLGQLVPGTTHQTAAGELLPQSLLWFVAAALLASDSLLRLTLLEKHSIASTLEKESPHHVALFHRSRIGLIATMLLVAALFWMALATWRFQGHGNLRFALNTFWQWTAVVVSVFVIFRVVRSVRTTRMVFGLMISLAWMTSIAGFYQVNVSLPRDRAAFKANPSEVLKQNGVEAAPGTAAYLRFESRLNDDTPLGPFALTNSLAGFLVPWIVLMIGLGARRDFFRSSVWRTFLGMFVFSTLLWCLILTKSRAAWLAICAGVVAIWLGKLLVDPSWRSRVARVFQTTYGLQMLGLIAFAGLGTLVILQAWDSKLLSEAGRSLLFRAEYWSATTRMIADHPLLGIGPGNFQAAYSSYKPWLAPETVVDPHNFVLETAAVFGLPAGLLLVFAITILSRAVIRFLTSPADDSSEETKDSLERESRWDVKASSALYIGGIAGALALWFGGEALGMPPDGLPFLLAMPFVVLALMTDYFFSLQAPPRSMESKGLVVGLAAALLALGVHLSASSGWMTPGVTNSGCVLIAAILGVLTRRETDKPKGTNFGRERIFRCAVLAGLSWLVVGLFYWTTWLPIQNVKALYAVVEKLGLNQARARELIAADPLDPTGYAWLAEVLVTDAEQQYSNFGRMSPEAFQSAKTAVSKLIEVDPSTLNHWLASGNWLVRLSGDRPDELKEALKAYRTAADRDPGDVGLQVQAAWAAWLCEETSAVEQYLTRAWTIDQTTSHIDRKLAVATVFWPANVGAATMRIGTEKLRKVRQTAGLSPGWVRAQPVAEFLLEQIGGPNRLIR
jgi:hypothetical protein